MAERLADVLAIADDERAGFVAFARRAIDSLPSLPINARPRSSGNLPSQTTPFIGRNTELAQLATYLHGPDSRLLTLIGEGGIGKTRLALQAAYELSAHFAHGAYFVSLAPLTDPELIISTIAEAVGFYFYADGTPKQQLLDFFREKSMLVILDNFEHLLTGATLVSDILQTAPRVKVLTTSRERLNLQEETLFRVEGMDLPALEMAENSADYGSVQLFVQSARRAQPSFALTADNVDDVARICRQVEGMPLGIVLAAAWIADLSLAEISSEIGRNLDFLETEARNVPARQRSIRAVFDHSWQMLSAAEQTVFSQLSVFRGGFTRDAAQVVAGATLKTLAALVHKSFIRRDPSGRYTIHELMCQYADAKLQDMPGALQTAQDQHCTYFADFMERQAPRLKSAEEKAALTAIETELDNVRTAWSYALAAEQFDAIDQSFEALAIFCFVRTAHNTEGEYLLQQAIDQVRPCAMTTELRVLLGQLLARAAFFGAFNLHLEAARLAFSEADRLLQANATEYERAAGHLWWARARLFYFDTAIGDERDQLNERLRHDRGIFEANNDWWSVAITEAALVASSSMPMQDFVAAQLLAEQSLSRLQTLGIRFWQIPSLQQLWAMASSKNEFTTINNYLQQIIVIGQEFGSDRDVAFASLFQAVNYKEAGDYSQAKTYFELAWTHQEHLGNRIGMARTLEFSGFAAQEQGLYSEAYSNYQQAASILEVLGRQYDVVNEWKNMARAAIGQGNYALTERHCRESWAFQIHLPRSEWPESFLIFGYLIARSGDLSRGISLLTATVRLLEEVYEAGDMHLGHFSELHSLGETYLAEFSAELSAEAFAAAQQDAKSLNMEQVAAELLTIPPLFSAEKLQSPGTI